MEIQTASVLNAGDRALPVSAASRRADALGLAALAQGRVSRDPELAGASANLTVAAFAEKAKQPISFVRYLKYGFPIMLLTLAIANVYLWLRYF